MSRASLNEGDGLVRLASSLVWPGTLRSLFFGTGSLFCFCLRAYLPNKVVTCQRMQVGPQARSMKYFDSTFIRQVERG